MILDDFGFRNLSHFILTVVYNMETLQKMIPLCFLENTCMSKFVGRRKYLWVLILVKQC